MKLIHRTVTEYDFSLRLVGHNFKVGDEVESGVRGDRGQVYRFDGFGLVVAIEESQFTQTIYVKLYPRVE